MIIKNGMNKIINSDLNLLKSSFLKSFFESLEKLKNNDKITIWLSWWNSLKLFYEELKNNFESINKDLRNKIYFCFLDERIVDFSDENSNYNLVKNLFLDELLEKSLVISENILLPDFTLDNCEYDYFNKIQNIDIWLFWVWEDWHICSLFPNHNLLEDEEVWYLRISDSPKFPLQRITVSKNMIKNIDFSFIFFIWDSKKQSLINFLDENINYKSCPAKLVLNSLFSIVISNILF